MGGSTCSSLTSLVHMAPWNGLVWHERRQCTLALVRYINPCAAAFRVAVASRQVSYSSLPERYVPKKSGNDEAAGIRETRRSQPHDSESGASCAERRLRRERNVENVREIRAFPSENLSFTAGGENVFVKGFGARKQRNKELQQLQFEGDSAPSAGLPKFNSARNEGLHPKGGMESRDPELAAKDYCISLLALAPQPEAKLRMKMSGKKFSSEVMDAVIADLQSCGLQSDEEYAEVFARSRWNGNAWGPKRIRFELLRRGLSKENVEAGLNHVFQGSEDASEVDEEEDGAGRWGMSRKAAEQLISQARQRWSQGREVDASTRKRRMAGWLQRRGFSWDITSDLLRVLEREELD